MPQQLKKQIPRSCNRHHFCKAMCHGQPTPPLCGGPDCHCKDCEGPSPHHPNPTPSPQSPGGTPSPSWVPNPTPAHWSPNPTKSPEGHTPSPSPAGPHPTPTPKSTTPSPSWVPNPTPAHWSPNPTKSPEGHTPSPSPAGPHPTPTPKSTTPSPSWVPNPTPAHWSPNPTKSPEGHTPSPSPAGPHPTPTPKSPLPTASPTPVSLCKRTLEAYSACGGINSGSGDAQMAGSCCTDGFSCVRSNPYYWQCVPTSSPTPSPKGYNPSPTPSGPSPTPSPKGYNPSPTPWGDSPTPSPQGTTPSSSPTPGPGCKNTLEGYSACGGINSGSGDAQMADSCCTDGFSCVRSNPYYWQCVPTSFPTPSPEGYNPSPTHWGDSPAPSPNSYNPSPTPWGDSPTPSPNSYNPSPTHWGDSPTPSPNSYNPSPTHWGDSPTPSPNSYNPSPTHWGDSPTPSPNSYNPSPTHWGDSPTPSPNSYNPSPTHWGDSPTPSPNSYNPSPTPWGDSPSPSPTPSSGCKNTLDAYSACGGINSGSGDAQMADSCCTHGFSCVRSNPYYWQCVPTSSPTSTPQGYVPSPTPWSPTPHGDSPTPHGDSPTPSPAATIAPTPFPTPAPVCIPGQSTWCLAPGYGAYVGVALDFNQYPKITDYSAAAGWHPASYNLYVNFPLKQGDKGLLTYILPQIAGLNAIALITVEPWGGLDSCTEQAAADLADLIHVYELQGLTVLIRFAHEMNGRWGQQLSRPQYSSSLLTA